MVAVTIQLSAPAQWHQLARAARTTWPLAVRLDLVEELAEEDGSVLVSAHAAAVVPPLSASPPPRPGIARALIVGASPMTSESFTVWAQRALLGTANPAIDTVLAWSLPHAVTEVVLPGDARASHYARTAMRSVSDGLRCIDDVLLATSELTANALQHGTGAPQLSAVRRAHTVTVALTDGRPDVLPVVQRMRGASASSGRGMAIIDAISNHWGITVYHDRKVVWCELADDHDDVVPPVSV
jgi:anti-sigma regulatory factor (Ser/Thr protein kinase)